MITVDDLIPEVERAARVTASSWGGAADPEDIVQDVWIEVFRASNTLESLLSYESAQRGKVLRAIARQVSQRDITAYEAFSGQVFYSTDDVRRILERRRSEGDAAWSDASYFDGGRAEAASPEETPGSETITERLDLIRGFERLTERHPQYAELIVSRYIVDDLDMTSAVTRKALGRAREELTRQMNRSHKSSTADYDGPGGR